MVAFIPSRNLEIYKKQTLKTCQFNESRPSVCRIKLEQNYSEKAVPEKSTFYVDALKTRGIIYFNIETWFLFASPYQNFWLRACDQLTVCGQWRRQKISEGGQSFITIVWRHESTLGEVPKACPQENFAKLHL